MNNSVILDLQVIKEIYRKYIGKCFLHTNIVQETNYEHLKSYFHIIDVADYNDEVFLIVESKTIFADKRLKAKCDKGQYFLHFFKNMQEISLNEFNKNFKER